MAAESEERPDRLEGDENGQHMYSQEMYRRAWEEANEYMATLSKEERQELRERREARNRWAEDIVAGRRDPLDGMSELG